VDEDALGPLVVDFDVAVPPARAFAVWTRRAALWWPASHTMSGDPAAIEVPPEVGGHIVERAPDGTEYVWGEITAWQPPHRLAFRWHLFFDPSEATDVEVTFQPVSGGTAVRLVQSGWDRLGEPGAGRRGRTQVAWTLITARFATGCAG
jgi:uncharacterized protein YndB with AHSA1/START domain